MKYKVLLSLPHNYTKLSFWKDPVRNLYFFEIHYMRGGTSFLLIRSITYEDYYHCLWDGTSVVADVEDKFTNVSLAPQFAVHPPTYSKHVLNYVSVTINSQYFQALEYRTDISRLVRNYVIPKHGGADFSRYYKKLDNKRNNLPKSFDRRNAVVQCWANFSFKLPVTPS